MINGTMSLQGFYSELLKKEHEVMAKRQAMEAQALRNFFDISYMKDYNAVNHELTTVRRMLGEVKYGLQLLEEIK